MEKKEMDDVIFQKILKEKYHDSQLNLESIELTIKCYADVVAHVALLEKLLVDKKILTKEEIFNATSNEKIKEVSEKLQEMFKSEAVSSSLAK